MIEYLENMHFEDEDVEYFRSLNLFDEDFLAYLKNFRFNGDVYAFEEGTIMYPNEPVVTVVAPLIEAQLVETAILAQINHQSLIATKARRIVKAAAGRGVSDFGARRTQHGCSDLRCSCFLHWWCKMVLQQLAQARCLVFRLAELMHTAG